MRPGQRWSFLCDPLDDVLEASGAHKGNIQLVDGQGKLRIAASFGFDRRFLDFFDVVHTEGTACGTALKQGRRVVVPDVAASPIFAGTDAGEAMLLADCRAVQSTPLVHDGRVFGVISTHWRTPWIPRLVELRALTEAINAAAPLVWQAARKAVAVPVPAPSVCP
jgi:hypothetical protein